jgi:hypothetical protein
MQIEWSKFITLEDGQQLVAILNNVALAEGTNGFPRPMTEEESAKLVSGLNEGIARGETLQLFAREPSAGRIVSVATMESSKIPARSHTVELKRLASAPEWRGVAGRFLLEGWEAILVKCRERNFDIINIDVSEDGPYRLWQKLGFQVYAKIADYARVGSRRLDGYFLSVYVDEAERRLNQLRHGRNSPPSAQRERRAGTLD